MTPFLRFEYVLRLRVTYRHSTKVFHFNGIYKINFCISAGVFQLKYFMFPNKTTYRLQKYINKLFQANIDEHFFNKFYWLFPIWLVVAILNNYGYKLKPKSHEFTNLRWRIF